ncbi:mediator of RNA polymerase II transcription subunit 15 [Biomphalaria glabrata]|nr:mediator of RNA polymerase II transcription subunit 15-like; partial [Biomphalaria glabrata]
MFAIENTPSLPSTSSSHQEVPVVSSLASDSVFTMDDNFLLPSTSSPEEVSVVSSLVCDSVFTMEDNFLLPSTSSPQEVPKNTKKPNGKRKSASSSKGKAKKKKDASLGEAGNSSGEQRIVSPLVCSVFNMKDNFLLPSTSSYQLEVSENKTKQKAKPKSSKRKDKKKKEANLGDGENVSLEHQVLCCLNLIERTRQRAIREAIDELKQMDIPDFLSVNNYKVGCKCHTLKTVLAYIAHMMSQIENHDQIHGLSKHLQQQTQLHQQRLQEKLNVMQQEEAQYQLQKQEKEILLHQQQSVQQQQLIQQQHFLQTATNLKLQCDLQQQQLQSDQQQVILDQPQIQLKTQQILPNLQQPQLLFNPQQHKEMHHHQQQSSSQLYYQQSDKIVDQQITLSEKHQQP